MQTEYIITLRKKKLNKLLKGLSNFNKLVYLKVSEIPYGQTRSYKWVAEEIGAANKIRVVANVISKNPYPFLIPCHRVIRNNGALGGYMFGPDIKKILLDLEKKIKSAIMD